MKKYWKNKGKIAKKGAGRILDSSLTEKIKSTILEKNKTFRNFNGADLFGRKERFVWNSFIRQMS